MLSSVVYSIKCVCDNSLIHITILFMFICAHRERNFTLYVESMQAIGLIFFAMDHFNHEIWIPIHIQDMKELPAQTFDAFMNGNFVVNRSTRRFPPIAVDQGHDQLNKMLKGTGCVIELAHDPE